MLMLLKLSCLSKTNPRHSEANKDFQFTLRIKEIVDDNMAI